ncbi:MAG TPA: hypothetical protein ENI05_03890 [Porticoccus sp.]|nr:hypothetical protein [Porticoccus sp.]
MNKFKTIAASKKSLPIWRQRLARAIAIAVTSSALLSACGGGGGTDDYSPPQAPQSSSSELQGASVKGPMINAEVAVYVLDPAASGLRGTLVDTGSTNEQAAIVGVEIGSEYEQAVGFLDQLFLVEISGGTVITTGASPVINTLKTVIIGLEYSRDYPIYATPLSTLAIEIAGNEFDQNADGDFATALEDAEKKTKAAFGLGLLDAKLNLFSTPPIITETGNQNDALNYRTAIETFAAILLSVQEETLDDDTGLPVDSAILLRSFAEDLVDGAINGVGSNGADILTLTGITPVRLHQLVTQDPSELNVPGTGVSGVPAIPISELNSLLVEEAATVAPGLEEQPEQLPPPEVIPALGGVDDSDGDGVPDEADAFPNNDQEGFDSDGDCASQEEGFDYDTATAGNDIGNDALSGLNYIGGCGDNADDFPEDPNEWLDSDKDGVGDNSDFEPKNADEWEDLDGDGFGDNLADLFPGDSSEWADRDGDGTGDNSDACPLITGHIDSDNDGVCLPDDYNDNDDSIQNICHDLAVDYAIRESAGCFSDADLDGVVDIDDAFPNNPAEQADSDGDWLLNNPAADPDAEDAGNGFGDNSDEFPSNPKEWVDTDGDWADNNPGADATTETAGDGFADNSDPFPNDSSEWSDADNDGTGDNSDACPNDATGQVDSDGDTICDNSDIFPLNGDEQVDSDGDCPASETDDLNPLASDGDGCGDNSDFSICYDVSIQGYVWVWPEYNTAHGLGKAELDNYTRILTANVMQHAEIASGPQGGWLSDGTVRADYSIDIDDPNGAQSIKNQRDCVDIDHPGEQVDTCGDEALGGGTTYEVNSGIDIVDAPIAPDTFEYGFWVEIVSSTSIDTSNLSYLSFITKFNLVADVFSKHAFVETSRILEADRVSSGQGCPMDDVPDADVLALPQSYVLP